MIKRILYKDVMKVMENKQIPIIIGLRRIGKTTILETIASEMKNAKIISLDSFDNIILTDEEIFNKLIYLAEKYNVLLIDEVQVRDKWDIFLKNLFDQFVAHNKCKIVVTGSSSIDLSKKELGVNRTKRIGITTWDFDEYCELTKTKCTFSNFENYLGHGGFPDYFKNNKSFDEMNDEIIKPIIENDIQRIYPGINTNQLIRFIKELSLLSNGEVNELSLATKLNIDKRTVIKYVDVLSSAKLIQVVHRVDERGVLGKKRKYKVYINPHLHIMLLGIAFPSLENKYKGHIIESYWLHWAKSINGLWKTFYYLKDQNNKEIDFVSLNNDGSFKTLHEFKYKDKIDMTDTSTLHKVKSINKVLWSKQTGIFDDIKQISILDINKGL